MDVENHHQLRGKLAELFTDAQHATIDLAIAAVETAVLQTVENHLAGYEYGDLLWAGILEDSQLAYREIAAPTTQDRPCCQICGETPDVHAFVTIQGIQVCTNPDCIDTAARAAQEPANPFTAPEYTDEPRAPD